jgi:hypothetical protein
MVSATHLAGLAALWALGVGLALQLVRSVGVRVAGSAPVLLGVYAVVLTVMTVALLVVRTRRPERTPVSLLVSAATLVGLFVLLQTVS